MDSTTKPNPSFVVIDANVAIALCAKEADKLANADAKMKEYATNGAQFFAPGVIVAECLFVFCKKVQDGGLTPTAHEAAVRALVTLMASVHPPPSGDKSLIGRAEEIRGSLGCNRSADGIYLALAEELSAVAPTEVVTFDNGMGAQARSHTIAVTVAVLPTV
jgi:predicted nucleic acid-binding protein